MQTIKPERLTRLLLLVGLILITVTRGLAQDTPAQPDQTPTPTDSPQPAVSQAQPSPSPTPIRPKVIRAIGDVELDDIVEVHIQNLNEWAEKNDVNKLVPYISGRAIRGNYPEDYI